MAREYTIDQLVSMGIGSKSEILKALETLGELGDPSSKSVREKVHQSSSRNTNKSNTGRGQSSIRRNSSRTSK